MIMMLVEREGLKKHRESVWTGKGGGFCAVAIPLGDVPGGSSVSEL